MNYFGFLELDDVNVMRSESKWNDYFVEKYAIRFLLKFCESKDFSGYSYKVKLDHNKMKLYIQQNFVPYIITLHNIISKYHYGGIYEHRIMHSLVCSLLFSIIILSLAIVLFSKLASLAIYLGMNQNLLLFMQN